MKVSKKREINKLYKYLRSNNYSKLTKEILDTYNQNSILLKSGDIVEFKKLGSNHRIVILGIIDWEVYYCMESDYAKSKINCYDNHMFYAQFLTSKTKVIGRKENIDTFLLKQSIVGNYKLTLFKKKLYIAISVPYTIRTIELFIWVHMSFFSLLLLSIMGIMIFSEIYFLLFLFVIFYVFLLAIKDKLDDKVFVNICLF